MSESWARQALIVDHSPDWATRGAALSARLREALRPQALRVEHIGSTSVPGMAAKDVIDLQVSVRDLDEATDAFDAPLAALGFARWPNEQDHVPAGREDDPSRWTKRTWWRREHPDGSANVHVRCEGSPGERLALVFRDWFRAHPEAVAAYGHLKRALAAWAPDLNAYADAKDPVVDLLVALAEGWAERTGWRP
ncbi:GrpB family protein [Streptomyces sp. 4N509B]|uniref:GrpB family protein n=1 Tax=Streptomyces sp. 4N509B TaxID=3457413 RepID=UPI003FD2B873